MMLLDLFCCQGGAGKGYRDAGFEVVGVDCKPQPRYPFQFVQSDALEYLAAHGHEFDAVHASPPCQDFSALKHLAKSKRGDLITPTRVLLKKLGKPYVIENVPGAPLDATIMLCGTMFGLRTPCGAHLERHRYFEAPWWAGFVPPCDHDGHTIMVVGGKEKNPALEKLKYAQGRNRVITIAGNAAENPATSNKTGRKRTITVTGSTPQQNVVHNKIRETFTVSDARIAMGCPWMTMVGLSQAIPPAYTEWIGRQLMTYLEGR